MKQPEAGQFYWTKRGEKQRAIVLCVGAGRAPNWFAARLWRDKPATWTPVTPINRGQIIGTVDPNDYRLRRALQHADAALAALLLGATTTRTKARA
jgi:hypothetical protein